MVFYGGHRAGTVRAPCGHRTGTVRALRRHCVNALTPVMGRGCHPPHTPVYARTAPVHPRLLSSLSGSWPRCLPSSWPPWLLLAAPGCPWLLLAAPGCSQLPVAAPGRSLVSSFLLCAYVNATPRFNGRVFGNALEITCVSRSWCNHILRTATGSEHLRMISYFFESGLPGLVPLCLCVFFAAERRDARPLPPSPPEGHLECRKSIAWQAVCGCIFPLCKGAAQILCVRTGFRMSKGPLHKGFFGT